MDLKDFLKEDYYCDFSASNLQKVIKKFKAKNLNERELAVSLFEYVRDSIPYRFGSWQKKASEVLEAGAGMCTNKAVLLIALLRGCGIPAGFGVLRVMGREYFGPIVPSFLKKRISKKSVHIYNYVYLRNKWIKCDASDDIDLSIKTSIFNPQSRLVEWDGIRDAMLNLDDSHIIEDKGPLSHIDDILAKKPRTATKVLLRMGNLYLSFLRENNKKIRDPIQLETSFKQWVKKNYFLFYIFFVIACLCQDIKIKLGFIKY